MGRDTLINRYEEEVLRILDGEDIPGWKWGAAMSVCCEHLKGLGYAKGCYEISNAGKTYLERRRNEGFVEAD